jgi:hypothetical protein
MKPLFWFLLLTSCGFGSTDHSTKMPSILKGVPAQVPLDTAPLGHEAFVCKCPVQFELADSQQLTHIKHVFYKSKTGHLYERTMGATEINDHLVDYEYFNGQIQQEVDPLTFRPLEGSWYAIDKQNVYYYRPVSGGMRIYKIDGADVKTFKTLDKHHYRYAKDKYHFYQDFNIIENYYPKSTVFQRDERGKTISLSNKTGIYHLD